MILDKLSLPIVQAPLAGGPSTPELAAAVCGAGGLGFVAVGYLSAAAAADQIAATRALTTRPFGVNVFAPPGDPGDRALVAAYAQRIGADAGLARHDDDGWEEKLDLLLDDPPAVVSFTFGCPDTAVVERLHAGGAEAWATVTSPAEAREAAAAGYDVLVVQGAEAGGHRGTFRDTGTDAIGTLALLQVVAGATDLPMVAAGGIATGAGVAAVLAAGARAAQIGTALLRCPEAATSPVHREAVARPGDTAVTRAFTGRTARGIVNRFLTEHDAHAPAAYPEVHHLTAPIRAAARASGDADNVNLWAGQAHALSTDEPAADLVRRLAAEATEALRSAARQATVARGSCAGGEEA